MDCLTSPILNCAPLFEQDGPPIADHAEKDSTRMFGGTKKRAQVYIFSCLTISAMQDEEEEEAPHTTSGQVPVDVFSWCQVDDQHEDEEAGHTTSGQVLVCVLLVPG